MKRQDHKQIDTIFREEAVSLLIKRCKQLCCTFNTFNKTWACRSADCYGTIVITHWVWGWRAQLQIMDNSMRNQLIAAICVSDPSVQNDLSCILFCPVPFRRASASLYRPCSIPKAHMSVKSGRLRSKKSRCVVIEGVEIGIEKSRIRTTTMNPL